LLEPAPLLPPVPLVPVPVPLEPLVPPAAPESVPPAALGEDVPEDFAFLAFLVFFLAFGLSVVVVASVAAAEEPEVAPVEPVPVALGELDVPEVAPLPVVDEPEAPVLLVPDAPEELSLAPDADEPLVPDAPEDDAPGWPECGGIEVEVPLPPDMPASLPVPAPVEPVALCDLVVVDGSVALLPVCANAMDDTDATTISDKERRVVFNVMSSSF
jgi:fused signal recognition particle receptor